MSSRTGLTASMKLGLCVQRERRRGEGRGLRWVLGGKGGWASWVLRGSRVSHSTCLRWKRTPEKCVYVRLLWQPGLFL